MNARIMWPSPRRYGGLKLRVHFGLRRSRSATAWVRAWFLRWLPQGRPLSLHSSHFTLTLTHTYIHTFTLTTPSFTFTPSPR